MSRRRLITEGTRACSPFSSSSAQSALQSPSSHTLSLSRRLDALVLLFPLVAISSLGCFVDTDLPPDLLLTCLEDRHCPNTWSCDEVSSLCLAPGAPPPIEPELAAARAAFCDVLFNAAEPCLPEIEAALGPEAALVFGLPRPTFTLACVTDLLSDTTLDDVDDLTAGARLLPLLSCDGLASLLLEEFN